MSTHAHDPIGEYSGMKKQINYQPLWHRFAGSPDLRGAFVVLGVLLLATGCSSKEKRVLDSFATNSVMTETVAAGNFLLGLHKQGRLPGDSKDEHGEVKSDNVPLSNSKETYPLSRAFHLVKKGDAATNHYMVVRASKESGWELQRAWRTDSEGKIIEEWPTQQGGP